MTVWRRLRGETRTPAPDDGRPEDAGPAIGDQLAARRRERGLSLEDVERDIRINPLYLEALEREDWESLPAPIYARGFMRSYARYLGLDPAAAAAAVPHDLPRPLGLEPLPGLRRPGGTAPRVELPTLTRPLAIAAAGAAVLVVVLTLLVVAPRLRGGGGGAPPSSPTATVSARGAAGAATVPAYAPGTVPDFTGVDGDSAVAVITQLKLKPVTIDATNGSVAAGVVFDQTPAPGTTVRENDVVTLFVSKGSGN